MSYCMFPTDSDILDHVSINANNDEITIDLYMYTKLWDGNEDNLKKCVQQNLNIIAEENGQSTNDSITIKGNVQVLGREGKIPKTLYHITEKKNLESILEKGLIPQQGNNSWKTQNDYVYFTDKKDISSWLAILPSDAIDTVILEIKTDGLNIESGRHFSDYISTRPNGYGEYRTKEIIPASNIKEMEITKEYKETLNNTLLEQLRIAQEAKDELNIDKIVMGYFRLSRMPFGVPDIPDPYTCLFDDDNKDEESWDSEEQGDGLTEALNQMSSKNFDISIE